MSFITKSLFYVTLSSIFFRPFISNLTSPKIDYLLWLVLVLSATPFLIINKKRIEPNGIDSFLFLFLASVGISLYTSINVLNSYGHLYIYSGYIIIFYFIRSCDDYQKTIVLKTMIFSGLIICLYGFFQYVFGFRYVLEMLHEQRIVYPFAVEWLNRKRVFATFFTPNAYAGYLTMLIPLCVYLRRIEKKDFTISLFLLMMVLCFTNLILTFSVGAIFSVLMACFIILALKRQKKYKLILVCNVIFIALVLLLYWRYQSDKVLLNPVLSFEHRLAYFREALSMVAQHPWRGIGIGNFIGKSSLFVHNSYLQIWIEMGFLGFIAFLGVIGVAIRKGMKQINTRSGLFCALVAFAIHNLLSFTFFLPETGWIWWIVVGLIAC